MFYEYNKNRSISSEVNLSFSEIELIKVLILSISRPFVINISELIIFIIDLTIIHNTTHEL